MCPHNDDENVDKHDVSTFLYVVQIADIPGQQQNAKKRFARAIGVRSLYMYMYIYYAYTCTCITQVRTCTEH